MWIQTNRGTFCVVAHEDDTNLLCMRAHAREDLLALSDLAPGLEPAEDPAHEIPWHAEVPRDEAARLAAQLVLGVDYTTCEEGETEATSFFVFPRPKDDDLT